MSPWRFSLSDFFFLLKKYLPVFGVKKVNDCSRCLTAVIVVVVVESMPSDGKISRQNALTRTQPYSIEFF